jgi:hypothetical protein
LAEFALLLERCERLEQRRQLDERELVRKGSGTYRRVCRPELVW